MNLEQTLQERGARYGDFSIHAAIAQALQKTMHNNMGWDKLTDTQRQALTVIADKIARILSGDPNYADNWHDIQGYARLVEERLPHTKSDAAPSPTVFVDIKDPRVAKAELAAARFAGLSRLFTAE